MSHREDLEQTKRELNQVSPSFCLAKWLQVTLHLQNGGTHSCHHPVARQVNLNELKANPSALHNTQFKKEQRKKMLEGKFPRECHYCWKIEKLGKHQTSDRHIKSNDDWARPYLDEVKNLPWDANVNPRYLEVSFSSQCNFKCLYCTPEVSTSWMKEIREHGHYDLSYRYHWLKRTRRLKKMPIEADKNPYIDYFWDWFPKAYADLHHLRVTGGEPLLAESTFQLLDYIRKHPNPNLNLNINSNLGAPDRVIARFIDQLAPVLESESCRDFQLYTSLDSWGPQAEYIRSGLKLPLFERNIGLLFERIPQLKLTVMCTFNALGVPHFEAFLEKILSWKRRYQPAGGRVQVDISYLWHPVFLSVEILPRSWGAKLDRLVALMEAHPETADPRESFGFNSYEIDKMRRLRDYFKGLKTSPDKLALNRSNFVKFIREADRRRGTDFQEIFPELSEFFEECALEIDSSRLGFANICEEKTVHAL